jgi:8-oxo-dGTP pyrophosphatase MutT (NUDIX family)
VENLFVKQFRGVGAIIVSENSGKVMTVLRSPKETHPNTWAFAGGKVNHDESFIDALQRELQEELNLTKIKKITPLHKYQSRSKDFVYETYIVLVDREFIPELNWESTGYAWTVWNWKDSKRPQKSITDFISYLNYNHETYY